jgi:PPOX class probable F420-dependent enzyme
VLGTVDPRRGVHLVPVVFALVGDRLAVPIDDVKPKRSTRLRRLMNLEGDPRASLLADGRSDDWDALWWVRADLTFTGVEDPDSWQSALAARHGEYRAEGSVHAVLAFRIDGLVGWAASEP